MSSSSATTTTDSSPSSSKLTAWKNFAASKPRSASFNVSRCFDLTTSPSAKRASFPYSILPPLRHISYDELINDFLRLPSIGWTATGSFLMGMLFTAALRWIRRSGQYYSSLSPSSSSSSTSAATLDASRVLRIIITLLGALLGVKWISARFPRKHYVSQSLNVSSHSGGPCVVTGPVLTLTNSHAGTHADTPTHFYKHQHHQQQQSNNSDTNRPPTFDRACYSGDCIVLDISPSLAARSTREIDDATLQDAITRAKIGSDFSWENVFRIILCTKNGDKADEECIKKDQWRDDFAHFTVSGANFLTQKCPKLLMIGTDSPSVDRVDASPLIENAHGAFWKHRVAIVENIDCRPLFEDEDADSNNKILIQGQVQCVFNDAQKFEDAEGCSVLFYPE